MDEATIIDALHFANLVNGGYVTADELTPSEVRVLAIAVAQLQHELKKAEACAALTELGLK